MFSIFNFELNLTGIKLKWPIFRKKFNKTNTQILFIDDEYFPVVENLEKAGWSVKRVKDIKNIQDENVVRSHIIFVDYKGVGKTLSEHSEGLGIVRAIKEAYGKSKRVILYSAFSRFTLSVDMRIADNQLSKESNTYEFISMIESELKKI